MGIIFDRDAERDSTTIFSVRPPFPKVLMLEPSSACNLRCTFCGSLQSKRKPNIIELSFAKKIMQDAFAAGSREIGLYLTGESFCHPELDQLVYSASNIGYNYIYITTNGVLATKKRLIDLINNGLNSIKFSINAIDKKTYASVHRFDSFEIVMKNFYDAIELREQSIKHGKHFHRVMVSSIYLDEIKDDLIEFKEKLDLVADDVILMKALTYTGDIKKCTMIFNRLHITTDGHLTFCCQDFDNMLNYANLNEENIIDAWHNKNAVKFREKFLAKDIDGTLCGKCLYAYQGRISALKI